MGQVSDYVNGPYQGVSQAPQAVRLRGSCAFMEDCVATIPYGVQKRPPYEWLGRLATGQVNANALVGSIPRGSNDEDLLLVITENGAGVVTPRLFHFSDLSPVTLTVSPVAQTYLNAGGLTLPNRDLKTQSIEDVTFITNKLVKVVDQVTVAPSRPHEAIVWVKSSGYARKTVVTVTPSGGSPVEATFATSTGGNAADASAVGTDRQARALYNGTNPGGSANVGGTPLNSLTSSGFTVTLLGSIIYLSHPTLDFSVAVTDDQGGAAVVAIKSSVQRFSDLPALAVDGFTVEIAQEANGGNSNYYVAYEAAAGTTHGVWREVIQPGAPLGLDPETMPMGIFPESGSWVCKVLDWKGRTTGNEELSPSPGFVNDYITDVKWWRGRLQIVSLSQPALLSASDSPYKYYTTTLATALDSDPLGFLNPAERKAFFHQAVSYDAKVFTFGTAGDEPGVQTVLASNGPVSAANAEMSTHAQAMYTPQVPVQQSTASLFFGVSKTNAMSIQEMTIDRVSGLVIPEDATKAVPNYLPVTIDRAASYKPDYLSFYATSATSKVYVHGYYRANNERVQNAWWRWTIPEPFVQSGVLVRGTKLYSVVWDGVSGLHLLRQEMAADFKDLGTNARCYLDCRITEAQCASRTYSGGITYVTIPTAMVVTREDLAVVVRGDAPEGYPIGSRVAIVEATLTSTQFALPGDWTTAEFYVGYPYVSAFQPNHWFVKDAADNPSRQGRLTIRDMKFDLADAGALTVTVQSPGKPTQIIQWEGTQANDPETPADAPPAKESVVLRVPIGAEAWTLKVTISSDSHLGFKLTGYEWTGDWNGRSRKLS